MSLATLLLSAYLVPKLSASAALKGAIDLGHFTAIGRAIGGGVRFIDSELKPLTT